MRADVYENGSIHRSYTEDANGKETYYKRDGNGNEFVWKEKLKNGVITTYNYEPNDELGKWVKKPIGKNRRGEDVYDERMYKRSADGSQVFLWKEHRRNEGKKKKEDGVKEECEEDDDAREKQRRKI